jgi:hypothetical protein
MRYGLFEINAIYYTSLIFGISLYFSQTIVSIETMAFCKYVPLIRYDLEPRSAEKNIDQLDMNRFQGKSYFFLD